MEEQPKSCREEHLISRQRCPFPWAQSVVVKVALMRPQGAEQALGLEGGNHFKAPHLRAHCRQIMMWQP